MHAMTLLLLVTASIGLGVAIRSWWTLVLPVSRGCLPAVAGWASGHRPGNTPIAFLVATMTVATVAGILLRRSLVWRRS